MLLRRCEHPTHELALMHISLYLAYASLRDLAMITVPAMMNVLFIALIFVAE